MKRRITKKDWEIILTALTMVSADSWDTNSYGNRPDFEKIIDKVQEKLQS